MTHSARGGTGAGGQRNPSVFSVFSVAYILAIGCADQGAKPPTAATAADSADQVLINMQHYLGQDGLRKSVVFADTAFIYETSHLIDMRQVRVVFFTSNGDTSSVITGERGLYRTQDGTMTATGHVIAKTPDGRVLQTEKLEYDKAKNQILSEVPFIYDKGQEHLEGNGFTTDPSFVNVVTQQPKGGERKGGKPASGIPLPGQ
ncbi:MAG: LPS export ABC transporter periplasmic protein LptC [Gemmatimonadota bacterium]